MRSSAGTTFLRSRLPLAILAGLLLAASFPKIGIAGLAWIAPALMLAAALGKRGWESFRIGYVAGLISYLASLYWLLLIPFRWHSIPLGPALGWLALSAALAFFPATWVWLLSAVHSLHPAVPKLEGDGPAWLPEAFSGLLARSWAHRTLWALSGAAVWVALEMAMTRVLTGFPWILLGDSQYRQVPLIQIASLTGVYGLSFLLVWTSLSLLSAGLMVVLRPRLRSIWLGEIILPFLAVALAFNYGFRQLAAEPAPARALKVTLVQPSIPQTLIWDTSRDLERFRDLIRLSEQALTNRTDLLLWPEAAVPSYARWDTNIYPAITNLVRQHHVWLILGSDDVALRVAPGKPDRVEYYNASFLVAPDGKFTTRYAKQHLVVFGEYVPLADWLPFLKWFTPIEGGFTPGTHAVTFALPALGVKTSTLICFEDIFSQLGREAAADDVDFLVNLTNDGWFDEGAAQWQQAASALFRSVENGLPLVRCANNGLTCWVDAHGRLRDVFRDPRGTIYGPGFMTAEIPLPPAGQPRVPTFYNRHGDLFGWLCVGVAVMLAARRAWAWRRSPSPV
ncbi:MAG TPA: apolipoprotein N-acyltransferase [Candidatus Acidoferrum sp.]|nr:apolipoprotein N-acyltransferase [Candidatus Acidoferrum sp.]